MTDANIPKTPEALLAGHRAAATAYHASHYNVGFAQQLRHYEALIAAAVEEAGGL